MDGAGAQPFNREIPDQQRTVADIQRGHTYGANLPGAAPPRKQPLELRFQEQRRKLLASVNTTSQIGLVPLGCLGVMLGSSILGPGWIFVSAMLQGTRTSVPFSNLTGVIIVLIPLALALIAALLLNRPQRAIAERLVRNAYLTTWQVVQQTDVLLMIAQEDQHHYIRQRIDNTFGLRWASPPIPRTFEQHLEYAASYFQTYLALTHRAELVGTSTLINGSLPWYAGQRSCCVLGVVTVLFSRGCCIVSWYVGGGVYLQRLGRELALIDCLLFDEPQDLPLGKGKRPPTKPLA